MDPEGFEPTLADVKAGGVTPRLVTLVTSVTLALSLRPTYAGQPVLR